MTIVDPGTLFESLQRALCSGKHAGAVVGVTICDHIFSGEVAEANANRQRRSLEIRPGCITKLFTFSLLHQAVRNGLINYDSDLETLLGGEVVMAMAAEIKVRHLFNHAHGLDDSRIVSAPIRSDGFIDIDELGRILAVASPIARPGRFYSYGSGGPLLAAAVLETIHGLKFADVLTKYLFAPCGICVTRNWHCQANDLGRSICAATGGALILSIDDLVRLLGVEIRNWAGPFLNVDKGEHIEHLTVLPGWHSIEKGVSLGWKYYGGGWFGHNSEDPVSGTWLRMNPLQRVGIVVGSSRHPPTAVASTLFREYWPSLMRMETPKMMANACPDPRHAARYLGQYANNELSLSISLGDTGKLLLRCHGAGHSVQGASSATLHSCHDELFFLRPPLAGQSPFVQFICPGSRGFDYLWTGSQVLPHIDAASRAGS